MDIRIGVIESEMSAGDITVAVSPVLCYGTVQFVLRLVIIAQTVTESRISILVHHLVSPVVRERIGRKTDKFQRFKNLHFNGPPHRIGHVDRSGPVVVELPKYTEPVFRHDLLDSTSVIIAQRKIGVVGSICTIVIICPLIWIGKIGIFECIDITVWRHRRLSCHIVADLYPEAFNRCHGHLCIDAISLVIVAYEHSVVIIEAHCDIVCALVGTSAERKMVIVGKRITEQMTVPISIDITECSYSSILSSCIPLHRCIRSDSRPYLSHNTDNRKYSSRIGKRFLIACLRKFIPEFLFPGQFLH